MSNDTNTRIKRAEASRHGHVCHPGIVTWLTRVRYIKCFISVGDNEPPIYTHTRTIVFNHSPCFAYLRRYTSPVIILISTRLICTACTKSEVISIIIRKPEPLVSPAKLFGTSAEDGFLRKEQTDEDGKIIKLSTNVMKTGLGSVGQSDLERISHAKLYFAGAIHRHLLQIIQKIARTQKIISKLQRCSVETYVLCFRFEIILRQLELAYV